MAKHDEQVEDIYTGRTGELRSNTQERAEATWVHLSSGSTSTVMSKSSVLVTSTTIPKTQRREQISNVEANQSRKEHGTLHRDLGLLQRKGTFI